MSIDATNKDTGTQRTGVALVVCADETNGTPLTAVIERAANSGSVPSGSFVEIGRIENNVPAGDVFIDSLPSVSGAVYWYRAYHVNDLQTDSDYIFEVSASSGPIPDVDFSKRPWTLTTNPLELFMVVSASDANFWHVTSSINGPVFGNSSTTPAITVLSSGSVGLITTHSTQTGSYKIARPLVASNNSFVVFRSTLAGYEPATDKVELQSIGDVTAKDFPLLNAFISSQSATQVFITVSASIADGTSDPTLTVSASNAINTTVANVTPWNSTGSLWSATRPVGGSYPGTVIFRASSSMASQTDTDSVYIPVQDITLASFLKLQLNITGSTPTHIHVSASADNPGGGSLFYSSSGFTGGVVSVVKNGSNGFAIQRPTSGIGSVRFYVTSSAGGVTDYDNLPIPSEGQAASSSLNVSLTVTALTTSSMTVSASCVDPLGVASITFSASVSPANRFSYSNPSTGVYVIDRPPFNSLDGFFKVTATASGRISDDDDVAVREIAEAVPLKLTLTQTAQTTSSFTVSASCVDPLNRFPVTFSASVSPAGAHTLTNPATGVYTVTCAPAGQQTGELKVFASTVFGTYPDNDSFPIPPSVFTQRASRFYVVDEFIDAGGSYFLHFVQNGYTSSAQTASANIWRGSDNVQSASFSVPNYSPYVVITPQEPSPTPLYFRPQANSGSSPVQTDYFVSYAADSNKNYSVKIVGLEDTYNNAVETITYGIDAATPFRVSGSAGLSDSLYGYPSITIDDPGNTISTSAHPLQAWVRVGPNARTGPVNPITQPATGSSGYYQFQIPLNTTALTVVEVFATMKDGTTRTVGNYTLDKTFYPLLVPSVAYSASIATISGYTENAVTGSNKLYYKFAGSGSFLSASIGVDKRFSFSVSQSQTLMRTVLMNAENQDGAQNPVDFKIDINQYTPPVGRPGTIEFLSMDNPTGDTWVLSWKFKSWTDYSSSAAQNYAYLVDAAQIDNVFVTGGAPKVNVFEAGTATTMEIAPAHNHTTAIFSASYTRQTGSAALQWRVYAAGENQYTSFYDQMFTTPAKVNVPTESRVVTNVSAYLSNNRVYNVADYGAALDGTTDDSTAFNKAAFAAATANGIAYLEVPGMMKVANNISMSRAVTLVGHGVNGTSGIMATSQKSLLVMGSSAAKHMIRDTRFGRVNVVYGSGSSDYGRGCSMDNVLIEDCPASPGVIYRHHSYLTRMTNTHVTNCQTGVYFDFATAVSDSGANMVIDNSVIDNCVDAIYVNGMTADGCQIYITNTDLEHCSGSILKTVSIAGAGEAMIFLDGVNLELNTGEIFSNDGAQIWLNNFVALSATERAFIKQSAGLFFVSNGRMSWAPNKFAQITGGTIFVNPTNVFSAARWFSEGVINTGHGTGYGNAVQFATTGSTSTGGRVQLPGQYMMRSQMEATLTTVTNASPGPVAATQFWRFDGNNRTWDIVVDSTNSTANNWLRMDITNGVSTVRNDVQFPLQAGTAYLTITNIAGYTFSVRGQYVETTSGKATNIAYSTSDHASATNYDRALVFSTEASSGTKATLAIKLVEERVSGPVMVGL